MLYVPQLKKQELKMSDTLLLVELANKMPVQMELFETVPEFEIREEYLNNVPVSWQMITSKGKSFGMHSSVDHPSFSALRDTLENNGYIKTERNCVNGDSVIAQFKLNGELFTEGEKFPCAAALGVYRQVQRKLSNQ